MRCCFLEPHLWSGVEIKVNTGIETHIIQVPTVNFVIFPIVQTMTSDPLRKALYESYCYAVNNTASQCSILECNPNEFELPQLEGARLNRLLVPDGINTQF